MQLFKLFFLILILSSCSNDIKRKIGIVTPGPDEYQVQSFQLLQFPDNNNLPQPRSAPDSPSKSDPVSYKKLEPISKLSKPKAKKG